MRRQFAQCTLTVSHSHGEAAFTNLLLPVSFPGELMGYDQHTHLTRQYSLLFWVSGQTAVWLAKVAAILYHS